jgi:hypothetical protein
MKYNILFIREYTREIEVDAENSIEAEEKAKEELINIMGDKDFEEVAQSGYIECVDVWSE